MEIKLLFFLAFKRKNGDLAIRESVLNKTIHGRKEPLSSQSRLQNSQNYFT